VTDVLLATFRVGDLLLGLPVSAVEEVVDVDQVTPVPLAPPAVCGLINLRGKIVAAVDVRVSLGLPARPEGPSRVHVVLAVDGEPASLVVDEVGDVVLLADDDREDVPETVAPALRRLVTGAFQQESSLLLVLDPDLVLAL
jgi:purine-binding chemotaxis protein CheW